MKTWTWIILIIAILIGGRFVWKNRYKWGLMGSGQGAGDMGAESIYGKGGIWKCPPDYMPQTSPCKPKEASTSVASAPRRALNRSQLKKLPQLKEVRL